MQAVLDVYDAGKVCVLDIDVQGVRQVKAALAAASKIGGCSPPAAGSAAATKVRLPAANDRQLPPAFYFVFVAPKSKEDLQERLERRGSETKEAMQTRLAAAAKELE